MKMVLQKLSSGFSILVLIGTASLVSTHAKSPNTLPRVVTITQNGLQGRQGTEILEATLRRLDQAASFSPDIACLLETFTQTSPEPVPGPTTQRLSNWAKANNCYIICPIKVSADGQIYNSALLIDRSGDIVGRYDKIHPTENELSESVCPGVLDPPVFETDFGTIGIQICFDVNWRDQWRMLKEKGADIIFFPSAYPAERHLRTLAWLNQIYIVSSTISRPSSIYDISGDIIGQTGQFQRWAGAVLPLEKRIFEIDYHVKKMRQIQAQYGSKIELTWYHNDDLCSLASLDPDLTIQDLIDAFELTPHTGYLERAKQAQDRHRTDSILDNP